VAIQQLLVLLADGGFEGERRDGPDGGDALGRPVGVLGKHGLVELGEGVFVLDPVVAAERADGHDDEKAEQGELPGKGKRDGWGESVKPHQRPEAAVSDKDVEGGGLEDGDDLGKEEGLHRHGGAVRPGGG